MCGIAGLATKSDVSPDDVAFVGRMLGALAHRGPDDEFAVCHRHSVIGARRLAILDLSTGRQPLHGDDPAVTVSNNGEIYNYIELREELQALGHLFHTTGDTEIIAHGYEQWGPDVLGRLRGMFAIAVWDEREQRLLLARDRVGKKPLYWRLSEDRITWGSELKALLEDPSLNRRVDRTSLELYLRYQYVPSPRSILQDVNKLEPASYLTWSPGAPPSVQRYWEPRYAPKSDITGAEAAERLLELARESVRIRLRSDVPVGIFLSGGVDSGLVTALAADLSDAPLRTYSIGFADQALNELPAARAIASAFGTIHTEDIVELDAMDVIPDVVEHFDEPFGDSSALPTLRVAALAHQDVKVVLTGDGGDESFGGYGRYLAMGTLGAVSRLPGSIRGVGRLATVAFARALLPNTRTPQRLERGWDAAGQPPTQRYLSMMSIFDTGLIRELTGDDDTPGYLEAVLSPELDSVDRYLRADLLTYLPEDLLVKMDRATMAHGVEARSPLLDHHIVEFAASLPSELKIRNGQGKVLLRDVARQLLPRGHVDQPKRGFGVPVDRWFDGKLGDYLEEVLHERSAAQLIPTTVVSRLLSEHRAKGRRHGSRLWSALMLELWRRRWLDVPALVAAA